MAEDVVDRMLARKYQLINDLDREHERVGGFQPEMLPDRKLFAELAEVVREHDAQQRDEAYAAEHAFRPGRAVHTMATGCLTCDLIRHDRGVTS